MVTYMKTTVEIPDSLFAEAHRIATQEGTTLRALIEEGLRRVVVERQDNAGFRLRKASFGGQGLQPQLAAASWDTIRDLAYKGRAS
jgi:hypothetical protein